MTRAEAWNACKEMLEERQLAIVTYQRPDGTARVVYGSRDAGGFVEIEIPAGYDAFELLGRISARLEGTTWDGAAYLAGLERNALERAKRELHERKPPSGVLADVNPAAQRTRSASEVVASGV